MSCLLCVLCSLFPRCRFIAGFIATLVLQIAHAEMMGSVSGPMAYVTASESAAFVRRNGPNMSHFSYTDQYLLFLPIRPQVAGPSCARVLSLARPGSACAVCNTRATLWRAGALDGATTVSFIPYCAVLDIRGSCRYVMMLMRCDKSDSLGHRSDSTSNRDA